MAIKASATITLFDVVDIESTTWYYLLQSSTASVPAKPTTATPPSSWKTTEPAYTEGSTNTLYTVMKTTYSDGTFEYTPVSKSSSYEAAKTAYNKALAANNTANSASDKVDNMQIGGRNLFLKTGDEKSNNNYCVNAYEPASDPLIAGETYTVSICVTPAEGVKNYKLFFSGGYMSVATLSISGTSKQIASVSFVMKYYTGREPSVDIKYANAEIYRYPNDDSVTENSIIHWIKIEKGNKATDWSPAPEDIEDTKKEIINTATNMIADEHSIILKALEDYTSTSEFEEYKETNKTQLEQTGKDFTFKFDKVVERINTTDNNVQTEFEKWEKYIRFVDGNIILGKEDNQITLHLENDILYFYQNGNKVAYLSNNKLYVIDGEFLNSLIIGKFKYKPRKNGNLSFGKMSNKEV